MNRRPSIEFARISTMPRPQTEARGHLDRYQMAIEKARLEKELDYLETRRGQIHRRLQQLSLSAEDLDYKLNEYKLNGCSKSTTNASDSHSQQSATHSSGSPSLESTSTDAYQTFVLDF
jgi:phage shock protein A